MVVKVLSPEVLHSEKTIPIFLKESKANVVGGKRES
jgi:hypothetical protein